MDSANKTSNGAVLRVTRQYFGVNTVEFAERANLTRVTIRRIERGSKVKLDSMDKYTSALEALAVE